MRDGGLLKIMQKTDSLIDSYPKLKKASLKILMELIKEIGARGGAILIYSYLDNHLKLLAKKGRLNHKIISSSFEKGDVVLNNTCVALPIMIGKNKFGIIYLYGKQFSSKEIEYIRESERILDGRFRQELKSSGLKNIFERYVGEKTMKKILKHPNKKDIFGKRSSCTILFADINNFTYYANNHNPENVVKLLNNYFSDMSTIALKHGGTVDKFIGDAIMVVFGSPLSQKDHSRKAIISAKEMIKKTKEIVRKYSIKNGGLSIGIATGKVISGNIGSEKMMDYTVIGKKVNLASRLTSLANKNQILTDRVTKKSAKNINFKSLGKKSMKGFEPKEIFEVKL